MMSDASLHARRINDATVRLSHSVPKGCTNPSRVCVTVMQNVKRFVKCACVSPLSACLYACVRKGREREGEEERQEERND